MLFRSNTDEDMYQIRIRQLFAALIWLNILYALGITFLSRQVIHILYGEQYNAANICLKICVWYTVFSYLGGAKSLWLICEGKNNRVFSFTAFGALANVIMNFIFIPHIGLNGAAVATLLTQIISNLGLPFLFHDMRSYTSAVIDAITFKNIRIKIFHFWKALLR